MNNFKKIKLISILGFIKNNYFWEAVAAIVITVFAFFWVGKTNDITEIDVSNMQSWYAEWLDPIVTVGTFLLALFVWWDVKVREWENSLPKRITIHFKLGRKYIISCYNISIGSQDDIRAFAQQVGRQFVDGNLSLIPGAIEYPNQIVPTNNGYINYQKIEYYLTKAPEKLAGNYHYWVFQKVKDLEENDEKDFVNNYQIRTVRGQEEIYKRMIHSKNNFQCAPHPFNPKTDA